MKYRNAEVCPRVCSVPGCAGSPESESEDPGSLLGLHFSAVCTEAVPKCVSVSQVLHCRDHTSHLVLVHLGCPVFYLAS